MTSKGFENVGHNKTSRRERQNEIFIGAGISTVKTTIVVHSAECIRRPGLMSFTMLPSTLYKHTINTKLVLIHACHQARGDSAQQPRGLV